MIQVISDEWETYFTELVPNLMCSSRKNLELNSYCGNITIMRSFFGCNLMIEDSRYSEFRVAKNIDFGMNH